MSRKVPLTRTVAIVADQHLTEDVRWQENLRVHAWMAEDFDARNVDLVLCAGDVFDRRSTPAERYELAKWLGTVAAHRPVVIVRGNHDVVGDLPLFELINARPAARSGSADEASIKEAMAEAAYPVWVFETPFVLCEAGIAIMCLPWPKKAEIAASGITDVGEAMRNVLRGLGAQAEQTRLPSILLAHAQVRGSSTSVGQPLVGCDLELGLDDLALARADFVALGHIHKSQAWDAGMPVVYPGSPRRTAFGENEPKGYVLARFDEQGLTGWERVQTPCSDMFDLSVPWSPDLDPTTIDVARAKGAEIRLRYSVRPDQREAAKVRMLAIKARLEAAGAINVQVEEQVDVENRARAPEVAAATTVEKKLLAMWRAQNRQLDGRKEALLAKLRLVEDEALQSMGTERRA